MNPILKLWNLINWIIITVGSNEHICVEEVEHLLATPHSGHVDQGVHVAGLDSEYPAEICSSVIW